MHESFGILPSGEKATLYTISLGDFSASFTDYGAALVRLMVPDKNGKIEDVVLGYDNVSGYASGTTFLGAVVGRNANRIKNAEFPMNGSTIRLCPNENTNNLHSGPKFWNKRFWEMVSCKECSITFCLDSPHRDQGFPGDARIGVTYTLEPPCTLRVSYEALTNQDTVFNLTQHSYFNLAGHNHPEKAMNQILMLPARYFTPDDGQNIPTGELRSVIGTPMDFRVPKAIGRDIMQDYEPLKLQGGYDHNFEVFTAPCAILQDPESGRTLSVTTDCPGIQVYSGNYLDDHGKDGIYYGKRSGIALETQFYPDSVNHPQWSQPFIKAGQTYYSETTFRFTNP